MRLVRVGGHYDGSREQRLWVALAGLITLATLGIALLICDAGGGLCRPTLLRLGAGFAALLIAFRFGRPVTRLLRRVRSGRRGERLVADLLSGLPDDYWLVNDVSLGLARGTIEHVLIGPCGVGTVIVAPRTASPTVTGTSSVRSWPLR